MVPPCVTLGTSGGVALTNEVLLQEELPMPFDKAVALLKKYDPAGVSYSLCGCTRSVAGALKRRLLT